MSNQRWKGTDLFINLVGGRWTLSLLSELGESSRRYLDLHDSVEGISHKVLTSTLRRCESTGLIDRHIDGDHLRTATLYQLTELGRSLEGPLTTISRWVDTNWHYVDDAERGWKART
jgi:DNA-binding HxlR family transcriptional regulator